MTQYTADLRERPKTVVLFTHRHSLEAFKFTFLQLGELRIEFVPSDEKVRAGPSGTVVYWEVEDFHAALRGLQGLGEQRQVVVPFKL